MKNLNRILKNKKYLVFIDFEGTQFSHEVIASGLIKVKINDNGSFTPLDDGLLVYSKARCPVGKIVTSITSITDEFLKDNGLSFENTINAYQNYLKGLDLNETVFICFGSNDVMMLNESIRYSNPVNKAIVEEYTHHFFDFLPFIATYIKDDNGNNYSLVNYLKIYNIDQSGTSHNPLNDAIDLMNLFIAFNSNSEILFNEYCKTLQKAKYPNNAIKSLVIKLLNNENISRDAFLSEIKESLK